MKFYLNKTARMLVLNGKIDLLADTIKIALVAVGPVPTEGWPDSIDLLSAWIIGTPATLQNKSLTPYTVPAEEIGYTVFDADDPTITGVQASKYIGSILLYDASTSNNQVIAGSLEVSAPPTTGQDVVVVFPDNIDGGILKLSFRPPAPGNHNEVYLTAQSAFLQKGISWLDDEIRVALVKAGYTPDLYTDEFLDDLGDNLIATSSTNALSGKAIVDSVGLMSVDADDLIISGCAVGDDIKYLVLYKYDAGGPSVERLIALIKDTSPSLPLTPDGTDITIRWANTNPRIFGISVATS